MLHGHSDKEDEVMTQSDKEDEVMAQSNKESEEDEVILESHSYDELFIVFEEMQLDLEKLGSKYVMLQKKYKASIIKNKSLLNEIYCLEENNHNVVRFDIPCEKACI